MKSDRIAQVLHLSYNQTLNIPPDTSKAITIRPAKNELWRIKLLRIELPAPIGATLGTHKFEVRSAVFETESTILMGESLYNDSLIVAENYIYQATSDKNPTTEIAQQTTILNTVVTNMSPLFIQIENNTDATQTGLAAIRIIREVEYIQTPTTIQNPTILFG